MKKEVVGRRLRITIALFIITPIGFATKFYHGPAALWVNDYFGGVLYVVFWSLVVSFLLPKLDTWRIGYGVATGACCIELLQLWHPVALESVRKTFIGRTVLGTSFSWLDIGHYCIGCLLFWLVAGIIQLRK